MESPPEVSMEENLREAASSGDLDTLRSLVQNGVDVNDQHKMNGWTALHWAARRGHETIATYLIANGASKEIKNNKGETARQVTENPTIAAMLGGTAVKQNDLPITPNYIANPAFPYAQKPNLVNSECHGDQQNAKVNTGTNQTVDELVLKVRVAYMDEKDFIEIELDKTNLTYQNLLTTMCHELGIDQRLVYKVRKLPDTILRKDKDVKRLSDFQELELVLTNRAMSASSRTYVGCGPPRNEQIVY